MHYKVDVRSVRVYYCKTIVCALLEWKQYQQWSGDMKQLAFASSSPSYSSVSIAWKPIEWNSTAFVKFSFTVWHAAVLPISYANWLKWQIIIHLKCSNFRWIILLCNGCKHYCYKLCTSASKLIRSIYIKVKQW